MVTSTTFITKYQYYTNLNIQNHHTFLTYNSIFKSMSGSSKEFEEDKLLGGNEPDEDFEDEDLGVFQEDDIQPQDQDENDDAPDNHHVPNTLFEFLKGLDKENNSEDEGIEDYKIGGYHPCHIGEVLLNRYVIIQKLGWGHFSTVWLARDFQYQNYVAVKIMKSAPHYIEAAYDEVQILQKVAKKIEDPEWIKSLKEYKKGQTKFNRDDTHVVQLLNSFLFKGPYGNHFCMVFEILGVNLLQVLKRYQYEGVPINLAREISKQILIGLDFLHRICSVIHTDLKPENVLLCLTQQQIKNIVEHGQLANKDLFLQRLKLYRRHFKLGPADPMTDEQEEDTEDIIQIKQLKEKLVSEQLTATQKRNIKKKIKKIQKKIQQIPKIQKKQKNKVTSGNLKLLSAINHKMVFDKGPKLEKGFKVKIADLGNACWTHHHFATQIQTRQYRGPQVLLGSKYNTTADMWSFACQTFQMMTGDLLFNPRKDKNDAYGKNDDHIAQMMELLGKFPKKFSLRGKKAKKYFSNKGNLKRIQKLQQWPLRHVMMVKYKYNEQEATAFQDFMMPMLKCYPETRQTAKNMLKHRWLTMDTRQNQLKMSSEQFDKLEIEHDDKQEVWQYQSEQEDADNEGVTSDGSGDSQFFDHKRVGQLKYIDRSFTDLGYVGYGEGIFLQQLDTVPNWQFEGKI